MFNGVQLSPKIFEFSKILSLSISKVVALSKLPSKVSSNKPVILKDLNKLT